jgi:hypothetical protein
MGAPATGRMGDATKRLNRTNALSPFRKFTFPLVATLVFGEDRLFSKIADQVKRYSE